MRIVKCDVCGDEIEINMMGATDSFFTGINTRSTKLIFNGDLCKTCSKVEKENDILNILSIAFKERIVIIRKG